MGKIMNSNETIRALREELRHVPCTSISPNRITLQSQDSCSFRITNKSGTDNAIFHVVCEGQATVKDGEEHLEYRPRASYGFPRWLEVIISWKMLGIQNVFPNLFPETSWQCMIDSTHTNNNEPYVCT